MSPKDTFLEHLAEDKAHYARTAAARGHQLRAYAPGEPIDIFAFDGGDPHNGPACTLCGWGECWHCVSYDPDIIPVCSFWKRHAAKKP